MSDIKIKPSATGSATVTLTAPATGTARTVTLPDGTGSLIADNGSGSVGIGTSSPDGTVHIHTASAGSVTANADADDLVVENSGHTGINILSPDASRSAIQLGHTSDNLEMQIRHDGATSLTQVISDDPITFNVTDGSESARVTADGITFQGDTAAANALNDYEEGTWTPTAVTGASGLTKVDCHYTKIGNMVHLQGRVYDFTGINSSTLAIGGLPFNPQYSSSNGIASTTFVDLDQGYQLWMHLGHAEPKIYFRYQMNNAQYNSLVGSDISGSTNIHFNATYITAS